METNMITLGDARHDDRISVRTRNTLRYLNKEDSTLLCDISNREFLNTRGFGVHSLDELNRWKNNDGLKIKVRESEYSRFQIEISPTGQIGLIEFSKITSIEKNIIIDQLNKFIPD